MRQKGISALFRADASKSGGVGHVMRCLALAEAWTEHGGKASLIARTRDTLAEAAVVAAGVDCRQAPQTDLFEDARYVAQRASEWDVDWVVLDGYAFDEDYEEALKAGYPTGRIAIINDSLRPSRADLFVIPSSPLSRGSRIAPGPTTLVGGFDFAILRKEYSIAAPSVRSFPVSSPGILVVFGGTDAMGMVATVVEALLPQGRRQGWRLRVIAPEGVLPENEPLIERFSPSPSIAGIMNESDLIVCTASTVALEACACGIPQVLLVVADNQKPVADSLTTQGAALLASDAADVASKVALVFQADTYSQMSGRAASIVDGQGARRVASAMAAMDFTLRPPAAEDASFTFRLSNDPEVRNASFNSRPITWEDHSAWFQARLIDGQTWMRIAEDAHGNSFGVFRLQEDNVGEFVLSVALTRSHRGLKLAVPLIRHACAEFARGKVGMIIRAEVKSGNLPSERTFRDAGFSLVSESSEKLVFHLRP